jgi:hypothetical protein
MNQSTTERAPVQGSACPCGRPLYFSTGQCKRCRELRRRRRVAQCWGCGVEKRITARGMCSNCNTRMPPGSGDSARARHEETPQEIALAKAREDFFTAHVLPTTKAHAFRVFWRLQFAERLECVAEAAAVSWRLFVRLVASGRDPADYVAALAWEAVRLVRSWQYFCGSVSTTDAMSRRVEVQGLARVLGGVPDHQAARVSRPDLDAERREYLGRLSTRDRELVEFLQHNSVAETKAQFGLRQKDVEALLVRLCDA